MNFGSLSYHVARLRRELGQKLPIGSKDYRVRGYIPNRLTTYTRHELHLVAPLARAMARKPGLVIDVGVNTGQTLQKILSVDPGASYLGFEPQIDCCFFIDQFLRDNALATARVICLALSDEDGMLPIFSSGSCDEMASLLDYSTEGRVEREQQARFIPVRRGDTVLKEIGVESVGVLKVDVEGAEINVFRGLSGTIEGSRPICFFEVLPNYAGEERRPIDAFNADRNRKSAIDLAEFFHARRYELRQIDFEGNEHLIDAFDLDTPEAFVSSDYMAYPLD